MIWAGKETMRPMRIGICLWVEGAQKTPTGRKLRSALRGGYGSNNSQQGRLDLPRKTAWRSI